LFNDFNFSILLGVRGILSPSTLPGIASLKGTTRELILSLFIPI